MSQHNPAPERYLEYLKSARNMTSSIQRNVAYLPSEYPEDIILANTVQVLQGELDFVLARIDNAMTTLQSIERQVNPEVVE